MGRCAIIDQFSCLKDCLGCQNAPVCDGQTDPSI